MKKLFEDNAELTKLVELYLKAKVAYYEGKEIMTDAEFDALEDKIKAIDKNHPALSIVGYSSKRFEFQHLTQMLSLEKIQVNDEIDEEYEKILKWIKNINVPEFIIQPKYDGNSLSLQYNEGKIIRALSRGDGKTGFDVLDKVKNIIPNEISIKESVEIRGECLIDVKEFEKLNENDEFKNERNFVAGILNDSKENKYISKLHFVAFNITNYTPVKYTDIIEVLKENKFEVSYLKVENIETVDTIKNIYVHMKEFRKNSNYRLDGFVIKTNDFKTRIKFGENKHHPLYEVAIKFPAQKEETEIDSIEWTMASTGELVPTAILKPVYVDGTVVSRAYLANFKNAVTNKYLPKSIVRIEKKGDIIPQITKLIKDGEISAEEINNLKPNKCPFCQSAVEITEDMTHIYCSNENCSEKAIKKMVKCITILEVKNIGPAMVKMLYNAGVLTIIDVFKKDLTEEKLIKSGLFKKGRQLEKLFESINQIKTISFEKLLELQQIDGAGSTIAEMVTKNFLNIPHSFSGLEKKVVDYFIEKKDYFLNELPKIWEEQTNVKIVYPEYKEKQNTIKVVLTGSPKSAGFPTKKHFLDRFTNLEEVSSMKEAKYLITDDLSSTSSKMKDAEKLKVEIKTYADWE